jgi:hypothetical protein
MDTKPIIILLFVMLTTFMPINGWDDSSHVRRVGLQGNNSGASIFEAYDETKSLKQRFERLDGFALYLKENPTFQAYVMSYGGRRSCRGEALRRARFAKQYLSNAKGIDRKRITTLDGGYLDQWAVYLWVGEQGEALPVPLPTVPRRDVQVVRNCKLKISKHERGW